MRKLKIVISCLLAAVLLMLFFGWYILIYGQYIDKDSVSVNSVRFEGNTVILEGDTSNSALAFAGYSSGYETGNLIIKLRYALRSPFHRSGHFKITYDSRGRKIEKILIEGNEKGDYKQVWSEGKSAQLAFKGYELYVWKKNGDTYYTLLLGTNRAKTDEEKFDIKVAVKGLDVIKKSLDSMSEGESVFVQPIGVSEEELEPLKDYIRAKNMKTNLPVR